MLNVVDLGDNSEHTIDLQDLESLKIQNVWVRLTDPTEEEIRTISERAGISKSFLDLPKRGPTANLRLEDEFTIINFVIPQDVFSTKEVEPIIIAFTKTFVITVNKNLNLKILDTVKERMSKTKFDPPGMVAYFIIDEIVNGHFLQLETLETLTSSMEEDVVEKNSPDTLKKIFNLKSKLISFNKMLWYERGLIFNLKTCGEACMPRDVREMFNTTHEDLTRQIDIVETYREIMSDAINVHLSAVSNKINFSIKSLTVVIFYLTIVTTVTSFPNTVATFFGISQFGGTNIIIIVTALILSTTLPFLWLWRKKWLKLKQAE